MSKEYNNQFKQALILSGLLHIILVGLFLFGLPNSFEKLPEEKKTLTFEIVSVKNIDNIKTQSKSKIEEKSAKKSKKAERSKPEPKKKITEKKQATKNNETKKEIIPKKDKQIQVKKPEPKKEDSDPLDDILKNLEKESEGTDVKTPTRSQSAKEKSKNNAKGDKYDETRELSISEKNYIKNIITKHWRKPAGSEFEDGLKTIIKFTIQKNGKIKSSQVLETICPRSDLANMCKLVEESMNRALKQIDTIENLSPERYNDWKEIILEVVPSEF